MGAAGSSRAAQSPWARALPAPCRGFARARPSSGRLTSFPRRARPPAARLHHLAPPSPRPPPTSATPALPPRAVPSSLARGSRGQRRELAWASRPSSGRAAVPRAPACPLFLAFGLSRSFGAPTPPPRTARREAERCRAKLEGFLGRRGAVGPPRLPTRWRLVPAGRRCGALSPAACHAPRLGLGGARPEPSRPTRARFRCGLRFRRRCPAPGSAPSPRAGPELRETEVAGFCCCAGAAPARSPGGDRPCSPDGGVAVSRRLRSRCSGTETHAAGPGPRLAAE